MSNPAVVRQVLSQHFAGFRFDILDGTLQCAVWIAAAKVLHTQQCANEFEVSCRLHSHCSHDLQVGLAGWT